MSRGGRGAPCRCVLLATIALGAGTARAQTVGGADALDDPDSVPIPDPPAHVVAPAPAPEPPSLPERYPRMVIAVSAGYAFFLDPVELSEHAVLARAGAWAQLLEWLFVGGSLEGGAIFEPFGHVQPFLRSCAEPQAAFVLGSMRFALGPKLCISVSRHLRGIDDHWASGAAFGGLARLTVPFSRGLGIVFRVDVDAWERDLFVETPPAPFGGAPAVELPWAGMIGASLELELR